MKIRAIKVARVYTEKVLELCWSEKGRDASRTFAEIRCQVDAIKEAVPALECVQIQTYENRVSLRIYHPMHARSSMVWENTTRENVVDYVAFEIAEYLEA